MTIRGLWVRVTSLPHDAPFWAAQEAAAAKAEADGRAAALDDVYNRYRPKR
jgi:hypothetical protein